MRKRIPTFFLLFFFFASPVLAASPLETIQTAVDGILEILRQDDAPDEAQSKAKAEQIKAVIEGVFDFEVLSRVTLGRDWRQLNDAQKEEFVALYSELLERTYLDRIYEYTDEEVVYVKETMLTDRDARVPKAEVETIVKTQDKDVPVIYRLYAKNGKWLVYDLHGEGVSLVQNYRTQFDDLLHRGSVEEMLQQLREKVSTMHDVVDDQSAEGAS